MRAAWFSFKRTGQTWGQLHGVFKEADLPRPVRGSGQSPFLESSWLGLLERLCVRRSAFQEYPVLRFNCPKCSKRLKVAEDLVQQAMRCPKCGQSVEVPCAVRPVGVSPEPNVSNQPPLIQGSGHIPADEFSLLSETSSRNTPSPQGSNRLVIVMTVMLILVVGGVGGYFIATAHIKTSKSDQTPSGDTAQPNPSKPASGPDSKQPGQPITKKSDERPKGAPDKQVKKQLPKVDEKTERLQKIDKEALALRRKGVETKTKGPRVDALKKWLDAIAPYQKLTPDDCTQEESLAVATIYLRIAVILALDPSTDNELFDRYQRAAHAYARRGGIEPADYKKWYDRVVEETVLGEKPK